MQTCISTHTCVIQTCMPHSRSYSIKPNKIISSLSIAPSISLAPLAADRCHLGFMHLCASLTITAACYDLRINMYVCM